MDADLRRYYDRGVEVDRLASGIGLIEAARTKELVSRYLLDVPLSILDVGGGAGYYADWLARTGRRVLMVDPVPSHVDRARERAGSPPCFEVELADARQLAFEDASFDAVLVLGPEEVTDRVTRSSV